MVGTKNVSCQFQSEGGIVPSPHALWQLSGCNENWRYNALTVTTLLSANVHLNVYLPQLVCAFLWKLVFWFQSPNSQTEHLNQKKEVVLHCASSQGPSTWSKQLMCIEYTHNATKLLLRPVSIPVHPWVPNLSLPQTEKGSHYSLCPSLHLLLRPGWRPAVAVSLLSTVDEVVHSGPPAEESWMLAPVFVRLYPHLRPFGWSIQY